MTAIVALTRHEHERGKQEGGYTVAQVSDLVKRYTGTTPSLLELERQVGCLVRAGLLEPMKGRKVALYPMLLGDDVLSTYHLT